MAFRPAHELTIDGLLVRAWRAKADEHAGRWPRARRWLRQLSGEVRDELRRRGFDIDLAGEIDEQITEVDGHADIWRIFLDADLFGRMVRAMATPFESERITKIVALEARGFLLAGALAVQLGAGLTGGAQGGRPPARPKAGTASRSGRLSGPSSRVFAAKGCPSAARPRARC